MNPSRIRDIATRYRDECAIDPMTRTSKGWARQLEARRDWDREVNDPEVVLGLIECHDCGWVEHQRIPEDEAHCPCRRNGDMADPTCICGCHRSDRPAAV